MILLCRRWLRWWSPFIRYVRNIARERIDSRGCAKSGISGTIAVLIPPVAVMQQEHLDVSSASRITRPVVFRTRSIKEHFTIWTPRDISRVGPADSA